MSFKRGSRRFVLKYTNNAMRDARPLYFLKKDRDVHPSVSTLPFFVKKLEKGACGAPRYLSLGKAEKGHMATQGDMPLFFVNDWKMGYAASFPLTSPPKLEH